MSKSKKSSGNYFVLQNDIFDYELSSRAFLVFAYLKRCADTCNRCYPSRKDIAKKCCISISSVDKAMRELKSKALVHICHRYNDEGQTSNLYTLNDT